jgi:hypothetical protein
MGFWLIAAASAQVRASPMSDRLSFSVVAFAAQRSVIGVLPELTGF